MKYILMHKEIPVIKLDLDEIVSGITKIKDIYNEAHLPVSVNMRQGVV